MRATVQGRGLAALMAMMMVPVAMPMAAADTRAPAPTLIPFEAANQRWGYLDARTLEVVIEPRYQEAGLFHQGLALVTTDQQAGTSPLLLEGWIDRRGEFAIAPQFVVVRAARTAEGDVLPGLYLVQLPGYRSGVISLKRRGWLIPPSRQADIEFFSRDLYQVDPRTWISAGDTHSVPSGTVIDRIDVPHRTVHVMARNGNVVTRGVLSLDGRVLIPPEYVQLTVFPDLERALGVRRAKPVVRWLSFFNGMLGRWLGGPASIELVTDDGRVLRTFAGHHEVHRLFGPIAYEIGVDIHTPDSRRYLDLRTGDYLDRQFVAELARQKGVFERPEVVRRDGKLGVADADGRFIIPPVYAKLRPVQRRLGHTQRYYRASQGEGWGLLSQNGDVLVPLHYDSVGVAGEDVRWGWATVTQGERRGLVNMRTGVTLPLIHGVYEAKRDVIIAYRTDRESDDGPHAWFQLWSPQGEALTHKPYNRMVYQHGYLVARLDSRNGVLSVDGKVLVPFRYAGLEASTDTLVLASENGVSFHVGLDGREYRPRRQAPQ